MVQLNTVTYPATLATTAFILHIDGWIPLHLHLNPLVIKLYSHCQAERITDGDALNRLYIKLEGVWLMEVMIYFVRKKADRPSLPPNFLFCLRLPSFHSSPPRLDVNGSPGND